MSLFGGAAAAQSRSRNLVEFKAGKMNLRGTTVYPDKRKGLVYLYQGNDLMMHLCWKDRSNNALVDDLVIFPDEVQFKRVTQNTTGRVYVLKWKSNNRKLFFWMQEPKEDRDEEFCRKINDLLNHPPTSGFDDDDDSAISSAHPLRPLLARMTGGRAGGIDPNDLNNVLRGMDPSDFASLLTSFRGGGGGPGGLMQGLHRPRPSNSNTTPQRTTRTAVPASNSNNDRATSSSSSSSATVPTTATNSKTNPVQMSALTNVLSNLSNPTTQENATPKEKPSTSTADLHDLVDSEVLIPLLCDKDVQEKLRVYLPEEDRIPSTEKELRESIASPQFLQLVNAFSFALQSGELGAILTRLGFPDDVTKAANEGDIQSFAQAISNHYKSSRENSSNPAMDVDE